ncbi:MAG: Ig-like domain-containing protein [Bacteroidetes bacterium]|nr:Ig-like domain-containing protein [Bacteroidota bacterium]
MKKYFTFFIFLFVAIVEILFQSSCANIIPPTGGPRDSLPPVLIKAVPSDSTLNFHTNKIVLTFNEYIQLDNTIQQTLIVSPNPVTMPYVKGLLQNVTIRLKDSLLPNTTYSINFGNGLKDVNEGNIYKNFTYVFSTGNTIANGQLLGQVTLAETGKIDSTLIVVLQSNLNDSAIKKLRPVYYTSLDSGGNFHFRYIEPGKYNVFVLPNDYTKKYDDSTKTFAFLNEPVTIDSISPEKVTMYAYNEYPENKNAGVGNSGNQKAVSPGKKNTKDTTIRFATNLSRSQQDLLSNLDFYFQQPLEHFDSTKINFTDTSFKPVTGYRVVADTSFKTFSLLYPWKEDQHFKLIVQKDAFTDSSGHQLAKTDTIAINTRSESDYGSIRLRFANLELSNNPVLQLLQNDKVVDSVQLTGTEFYRRLFAPGDYELRVLYDLDKNMTWTPGNYDLKKQPEIVVRIPRKITIKENWDNEINVQL